MEKKLEEFLNLNEEEFEFVNSARRHIDAVLERDFDIWGVRVGIGIFDVLVYVRGEYFIYRLKKNFAIEIFKTDENDVPLTEMKIELRNDELYNNIVDKLNNKRKAYLSIKLIELTNIELPL